MKKIVAAIALLSLSSASFANVTEAGKITRIIMESNSIIYVWLDGPDNNAYCADGARWSLHTSDALYQSKLSLLMLALSNGKTVSLLHTPGWGCGGPQGVSNRIYSIDVRYYAT